MDFKIIKCGNSFFSIKLEGLSCRTDPGRNLLHLSPSPAAVEDYFLGNMPAAVGAATVGQTVGVVTDPWAAEQVAARQPFAVG